MGLNSVAWHKEGLQNHAKSIEVAELNVERAIMDLIRSKRAYAFSLHQYNKAVKQCRESYDSERFCMKDWEAFKRGDFDYGI